MIARIPTQRDKLTAVCEIAGWCYRLDADQYCRDRADPDDRQLKPEHARIIQIRRGGRFDSASRNGIAQEDDRALVVGKRQLLRVAFRFFARRISLTAIGQRFQSELEADEARLRLQIEDIRTCGDRRSDVLVIRAGQLPFLYGSRTNVGVVPGDLGALGIRVLEILIAVSRQSDPDRDDRDSDYDNCYGANHAPKAIQIVPAPLAFRCLCWL